MTALPIHHSPRPPLRLAPLETVGPTEHQQKTPSAITVECKRCTKLFFEGAVVTSEVIWGHEFGTHYVIRRVYCDFCNHLIRWKQASNARGTCLGPVLEHRTIHKQIEIDRFLKANPQAAGVAQS